MTKIEFTDSQVEHCKKVARLVQRALNDGLVTSEEHAVYVLWAAMVSLQKMGDLLKAEFMVDEEIMDSSEFVMRATLKAALDQVGAK